MKQIVLSPRIEFIDYAWKYFVNESYLERLNAYPISLLMPVNMQNFEALAKQSDGLILTGGYDVTPDQYNAVLDQDANLYGRPVDLFDLLLLDAFIKEKKPILGICRGLQIINTYFHGTLSQTLDLTAHEEAAHEHRIRINTNSIFSQCFKQKQIVNSYHHQCIDTLGEGLIKGAEAMDGTIEAFAHTSLPITAVQWHPEKCADDQILPHFLHTVLRT